MTKNTIQGPADAALILASRCSLHSRVKMIALNWNTERAEQFLYERCLADMRDSIFDSPERDDPCALAARYLHDMPGPIIKQSLETACHTAIQDRLEEE